MIEYVAAYLVGFLGLAAFAGSVLFDRWADRRLREAKEWHQKTEALYDQWGKDMDAIEDSSKWEFVNGKLQKP